MYLGLVKGIALHVGMKDIEESIFKGVIMNELAKKELDYTVKFDTQRKMYFDGHYQIVR